MKFSISFLPLSAVLLVTVPRPIQAGTFRDDRGVTHVIAGRPKIVTYARTAVTLSHFGLKADQLVGVYGEYAHDGSDYDFNNIQKGSTYPADPTPEEMQLITSVKHISPSCLKGYCQEFDLEIFPRH